MEKLSRMTIDPKKAGVVLVIVSVLVFVVTLLMTQTIMDLRMELHKSCPLPPESCPYKSSVPVESVAAFVMSICTGVVGGFLIFSGKSQTEKKSVSKKSLDSLMPEEKRICDMVIESGGSMYQNDIVKNTGFSKVKVSRILDKLEMRGFIERRRMGMANMVVLK